LRSWNLADPVLFRDEAESAINALTILEHGVPTDRYLSLPIYENTLTRPWPDSEEYEFKDTSYSDRGFAVYHGWLPLYAIAASFVIFDIVPDKATDPPQVRHDDVHMRRRALAAPWYVHLPESLSNWRVTQEWLYWQRYEYLPLKAMLRLMWSFFTSCGPWGGGYRQDLLAVAVVGLLGLLTCRLALNTLVMKRTRLLWLWLLAAWFGPVLFDLIKGTYVVAVHRYAIAGFPAAILLLSVLLARVPKPLPRVSAWLR
jgi:hypothetical protein